MYKLTKTAIEAIIDEAQSQGWGKFYRSVLKCDWKDAGSMDK